MSLGTRANCREGERRAIERARSHQLFHRMVRHQGIDPTAQWSRPLADMIFQALGACRRCASAELCRQWLQADRALASYVAFCPNAELIETCRLLDPDAPALDASEASTAAFHEPTLAELMADPVVRMLAAADGGSADPASG